MPFQVLGFLFGDLLFQQLAVFPEPLIFELAILFALVCVKFRLWFLLAFLIGWLWAGGYAFIQLEHTFLAPHLEGQEIVVQGVVKSLPVSDERRARFDFELTGNPLQLPAKLRLSWYYPTSAVRAGQHWIFKVKLKAVHGLMNPGGFDYEQWLFAQGIGATGYVREPTQAKLVYQEQFWQNPNVIRQLVAEKLAAIPHLQNLGFLQALTMGKTDLISPGQWRVLRRTGTLHLIAISGSHISLIAGLVYLIVWWLQLRINILNIAPQRFAAFASGFIGLNYAFLAGFSVPVQRALIMLAVALVGIFWQRHVKLTHLLAIAVLLILLWDPMAVLAPGFWLSFFAVMLIFYSVSWRLGGSHYWLSVLKVHSITALGLAPLLVGFFQQLSVIAPFANLIAVPFINILIVPPALIGVVLLFIAPDLAAWLLTKLDIGLEQFYRFLSILSDWHYSALSGISANMLAMCLAGIGFLVLFMPKGLPCRSLAFFLCLPLFFSALPAKLKLGEFKVTLLDVGQGLALVAQTAQHALIYDAGIKFSEQSDSGQSVILPFLSNQGIRQVDTLVVSHGDNDHIGGAASILAEFQPLELLRDIAHFKVPILEGL